MSIRPRRSVILIFAKAPVPGAVKTRLIPLLGKEKAAELQAAMITHSVALASQCQNHGIQLWCAPGTEHPLFVQLQKNYPVTLHVQVGEDLGQRMHNAFKRALKEFDTALIMGTDCPTITLELLGQAFQALYENKDVTLAPTEDGGYVLLGLKRALPELFSGIAWGTKQVYPQTLDRLRQLQLDWQSLDWQWDVDRPEDVQRLSKEIYRYNWHPDLQNVIRGLPLTTAEKNT